MSFSIKSLHYYPVKSLGEITTESMCFDEFGPAFDRRFMLVDDQGQFVTQRSDPCLRRISIAISGDSLTLSSPAFGDLPYRIPEFNLPMQVSVWGDSVAALGYSTGEGDDALSRYVGKQVRLVFMPDTSFRQVDRDYFDAARRVSFADGFPVLLCNEASLTDLNARLDESVPMSRFRPNVVFTGLDAFEEDRWSRIRIGEIEFAVVKPCSRCVMTTINAQGERGKEPLRTLATYRRNEYGVCFGQNLVPLNEGSISLKDALVPID